MTTTLNTSEKLVLPGPREAHPERIRSVQSDINAMQEHGQNPILDKFPIPGDDEVIVATIGGIGEIGMNLTMYGHKGRWIGVDAGVGFVNQNDPSNANSTRRYHVQAEFIDAATLADIADRIDAFVFTHGHEDHIGAVPYMFSKEFRPSSFYDKDGNKQPSVTLDCPLYATRVCAQMIDRKLSFNDKSKITINTFDPGDIIEIGPFKIKTIPVTHSIIEAVSLAIITNQGAIVHTGDWKIEENPLLGAEMDVASFKELGDTGHVIGVFSDSTNAGRYQENPTTEQDVISGIRHVFEHHRKGKVVVCCFASNVPRLHGIAEAAHQAGRKVGIVGTAMTTMQDIIVNEGTVSSEIAMTETDLSQLEDQREEDKVIICTGTQGEERAALARMSKGHRNFPRLTHNDVVIMSASVIPGNELAVHTVVEQLRRQGVTVVMGNETIDGYAVHVTGHATAGETRFLYDLLKPKTVVPVHGTDTGLAENAVIASETTNVLIPTGGAVISFSKQGDEVKTLGLKSFLIGEYRQS